MCDHLCPIVAGFNAAEKFIGDHADLHEDPATNLGVITLNRRSIERAQEAYPCPGPNLDQNGNVHCPLGAMSGDVFALAVYRPQPGLMIAPEKVAGADTDHATGQFL